MLGAFFRKILSWLFRESGSKSGEQLSSSLEPLQEQLGNRNPTPLQTRLTTNFTLQEATHSATAIRRGLSNEPDPKQFAAIVSTAQQMEVVRTLLGKPILINSWFRSAAVNAAVGGSKTSDHMTGLSVDFICPKFGTPYDICKAISESNIKFDQLIFETNSSGSQWVHIGFGSRMRQQVLTYNPLNGYRNGLIK